jgi:hypothetical protein
MLRQTLLLLLLLLLSLPTLIASLHCYSCKLIIVNYPVTSDTVPSFPQCEIVNATRCSITVTWEENINTTAIVIDARNEPTPQNISEDLLTPMAFMEAAHGEENLLLAHALFFSCMSSDKCNNETILKRILRSLTIEDKFRQELSPLIKIVSPFDPKSATCFDFNNMTSDCPSKDLDNCQRCQTSISKLPSSTDEVCATCPRYSPNENIVIRSTIFLLNNRTRLADHVQLDCQLKGCNSIDNTNRIYKASTITFNFDEFFENALEKIL